MNKLKIALGSIGGAAALLITTISAHAQVVTVDPTDAANLNAAVGSIPTAAKSEVFSIFPVVMPYILIVVVLGVAFFLVRKLMRHAH